MKINGTERTSWNYIATDIENNGANTNTVYLKNNSGKLKEFKYGFNSQGELNYSTISVNNIKYIEDITACEANYYIKYGTIRKDNYCDNSALSKRNSIINNNTINTSGIADIDIYQISHHGFNNSLNTYSYIRPYYAVAAAGKWKEVISKNSEMKNGYYQLYWPGYAGIQQLNMTGEGTVIYTIGKSGKQYIPVQLVRDDKDAGALTEKQVGKAEMHYNKE